MRSKITIKKILLVLVAKFVVITAVIILLNTSKNSISIILKNDAGKKINSVHIECEGDEHHSLNIDNIGSGESKTVKLPVSGESSYRMHVVFDDGTVLEGGDGYVEPGYVSTQLITDKKISSVTKVSAY